mgnify:CR=1 FL=1
MPKMILLPLKGKVKSAVLFDTGKKISHENVSGGVVLHICQPYAGDRPNNNTDCEISEEEKIK